MQTFLPYPDFAESAKCLDNKRLGKQRVEVLQILNTLTDKSKGWVNHPAVRMWRGFECQLCVYGFNVCLEWRCRGFEDTCYGKILQIFKSPEVMYRPEPSWFGDPAFHDSHKSNLLRKDPEHYGQFGWNVPNDLPYVWPKD